MAFSNNAAIATNPVAVTTNTTTQTTNAAAFAIANTEFTSTINAAFLTDAIVVPLQVLLTSGGSPFSLGFLESISCKTLSTVLLNDVRYFL